MEILRRSPMLGVLCALVSGLALYDRAGIWAFIIGVPLMYSGVMFCSYENNIPAQSQIFFAGLILSMLCSFRVYYVITRPQDKPITLTQATGTVTSLRQWGRNYVVCIDVDGGRRYAARLHFAELMEGTRIRFDGTTRQFKSSDGKGGFDELRYWRSKGASGWLSMKNIEELPERFSIYLLRYKLSRSLKIYLPKLTGEYLLTSWLGERTEELNKLHRNWGTSHLLAVSGFHVGLVMLLAGMFLGLNVPVMSLLLWTYIILTGGALSAMRAGLMIQIGLLARSIGRPVNAVNSVCAAGVILLMFRPFMFWDIGWRLSVISALTISSMANEKFSWLMISPAVSLTTFPQVSYTFKSVPVVGPVLNLIAPLYFSFAFMTASIFGALRLINFPLSHYIIPAVEGIFILWHNTAGLIAGLIPNVMTWNYFTAWIGTGTLIFFVCRYFNFAVLRTAVIMSVMSFAVFVMFL